MNSDVSSDTLGGNLPDNGGSEKMTTSDDEKPPVPWTELPCLVVENIYTYLSREDQCHMSMVCRNWNEEYSSPILWRKVKFLIPEEDLNLEVYPEVQFARKYGNLFRHVEIACRSFVQNRLLELIRKQLKLFLEALTLHSQLETVTFLHMDWYFSHLDDTMYDDLYGTIKTFFSSQQKLKTVEFREAHFKAQHAAEILRLIFLQSEKSLQNICLNGFIIEFDDDEIPEITLPAIPLESFLKIKSLQLDYSLFFENIMINFYEYAQNSGTRIMKGNLESITIFCDGSQWINYRGIPPECWKLITTICPSLKINLTFQIEDRIRISIEKFVVLNMPLKALDLRWYSCQDGSETEIGVIFRLLQSCITIKYLEDLSIVWLRNMNNLAIDIINFFHVCEKLTVLQLYIDHPVESLDIIFISWLVNRPPALQDVCITVGNVQSMEEALIYLNMLADDYCPLSQIRGLNLYLIVDDADIMMG